MVSRSLSKREASGSIPDISSSFIYLYLFIYSLFIYIIINIYLILMHPHFLHQPDETSGPGYSISNRPIQLLHPACDPDSRRSTPLLPQDNNPSTMHQIHHLPKEGSTVTHQQHHTRTPPDTEPITPLGLHREDQQADMLPPNGKRAPTSFTL